MTFPAGGGSTPAGGPAAAPPPSDAAKQPTPTPESGAEGQAAPQPKAEQPGDAASAAPPTPKVERPASFREALDRARATSASEGDTPAPPAAAKAPEPKVDAVPKTPAAPQPAPEPKKDAAPAPEPKAEKPPAAAAAAPKTETATESDADVSDGEDDDALVEAASKDDREAFEKRFPEADKGKKGSLDFAFRTARKNAELRPVAELVESVGGMDGAKLAFDYTKALTEFARPVATADEAMDQAEGFRGFLQKNAPGAYAKLESGIFWGAVQDTPEGLANVQALVDDIFGEEVLTVAQVKMLGNAFADGRIDLDALAEDGVDYTKTKAQREQEARRSKKESAEVAALREELAQLKGGQEETAEAKAEARQTKVAAAMDAFYNENKKLAQPILRDYGYVLPDDPESPQYKSMLRRIGHVMRDVSDMLAKDEDFLAVVGNISRLQTDGVHEIQAGTMRNKMKVMLRNVLDEVAPEAAAEIKRKNRLVADRVKQNGKQPTMAAPARPAAATPTAASNSERAIMDADERRERRSEGFRRSLDEGRRADAGA